MRKSSLVREHFEDEGLHLFLIIVSSTGYRVLTRRLLLSVGSEMRAEKYHLCEQEEEG
jgi:hypothetical protein